MAANMDIPPCKSPAIPSPLPPRFLKLRRYIATNCKLDPAKSFMFPFCTILHQFMLVSRHIRPKAHLFFSPKQ